MPFSVLYPRVEDHEHSIEGDPRALRIDTRIPKTPGFRSLMRRAKMGANRPPKPVAAHLQRCSVRVRYTKGGGKGKWYSHAKYITRKSAGQVEDGQAPATKCLPGFSVASDSVNVPKEILRWHAERDELFFRVIISPEFGDRMDLKRHVRETMAAVEKDVGTRLEWIGVAHYDTDNPHVHLIVRGRRDDRTTLRIDPEYIKAGWRARASEAATNQLGMRDEQDVFEAHRREVSQYRFTGLDRMLIKRATVEADGFHVRLDPAAAGISDAARARENHLWQRCASLEKMGMAKRSAAGECVIAADFEQSLRQMQRTLDLQKILLEHGVQRSDPKLPFRVVKPAEIDLIEGWVLVHGQNEVSGGNYTLVESISGEVLQIPQVGKMGMLRREHGLEPGNFMRLKAVREGEKVTYLVEDYGRASDLVQDQDFLNRFGGRLATEMPAGFGGWLGDMRQAAIAATEAPHYKSPPTGAVKGANGGDFPEARQSQGGRTGAISFRPEGVGSANLAEYRSMGAPPERWRTDAKAWRKHLEEKYCDALMAGRDVFAGSDSAPAARRKPTGAIPSPEYSERQKRLIEMHEIAAELYRANLEDPSNYRAQKAREYLTSRGITPELAREFGIGLAPDWNQVKATLAGKYSPEEIEASKLVVDAGGGALADTFHDRLMIPIQDAAGSVIAFAGRDLSGNSQAKYINSPGSEIYKKSGVLYNTHRAMSMRGCEGNARIVAVEGYMDAIAAHRSGIPSVAIGSASVTEEQAKQLAAISERVALNLDSDVAGRTGTRRALDALMEQGIQAGVVQFGSAKDPDEFVNTNGPDLYRKWVEEMSMSGVEWISRRGQEAVEDSPAGHSRSVTTTEAVRDIVAYLEKAPESLRPELSRRLSAFLGLSQEQDHTVDQAQDNSRGNLRHI